MSVILGLRGDMRIPIEILKMKDPDGIERLRAVISFQEVVTRLSINKQLIEIQNEYENFIKKCKEHLKKIQANKKNRGDPLLKWTLADAIYKFVKDIETKGYSFVKLTSALSRDLGISTRQINYLIEFRTTYATIESIHEEISWDKYKELLDINNSSLRKKCMEKILNRELKTREDIRRFKKRIKKAYPKK